MLRYAIRYVMVYWLLLITYLLLIYSLRKYLLFFHKQILHRRKGDDADEGINYRGIDHLIESLMNESPELITAVLLIDNRD